MVETNENWHDEMKTGLVYSKKYLEHDLGPGHPEKPARLRSIMDSLKKDEELLKKVEIFDPTPATVDDIELAHDCKYVKEIERLSEEEEMVDLDTPVRSNTYELALLAAGGTIDLSQKTADKKFKNGFALVRPPGHHATKNEGGGFCYFNNIAIAARKLLKREEINKVMIFDIDAHHGNGTQDIFFGDSDVLYLSFHQSGKTIYPGTGSPSEIGSGEGKGYTVNVPFPLGSTDENYAEALKEIMIPISKQFNPDIFMVSTGLDAHSKDPLTKLKLSSDGYAMLAKTAISQAKELSAGKINFVLEGGYSIVEASRSAIKIIEKLTEARSSSIPKGEHCEIFEVVKDNLSPYWTL